MTKLTSVLIINKKRSGFSAAQKNMASAHHQKLGVVVVKDIVDDDSPEFVYIECDPEKRKAQTALAEFASASAKAKSLAKDVEVTPAICEKLPKLIEKVSSDGSRSWGFSAK